MDLAIVRRRDRRASEWREVKPLIAQLYKEQKRPLKIVKELVRKACGFVATEAEYRTKIKKWGTVDASWKKNGKSRANESIAIMLLHEGSAGTKFDLYRWGERVPEEELMRIRDQNLVPLHKLYDEDYLPELPKGVLMFPQHRDRTRELTEELPFLRMERAVYDRITASFSLPITLGNTSMIELRDIIHVQRGYQLRRLHDIPMFEKLALDSILPSDNDQIRETGPSSLTSKISGVYISDLHRRVLCSLGNNLAGLGNMSVEQFFDTFKMVSSEYVLQLCLSVKGHLRAPTVQQLLRYFVEDGNVLMLNAILSNKVLQIDINEHRCEIQGQRLTLLERASMLRHKDLVEVMLRYGADVHKAYPCAFGCRVEWPCLHCRTCGALSRAICVYNVGPLDPHIFHMLLKETKKVNFSALKWLMDCKEYDFLIDVLMKLARTNMDDWQAANGSESIWIRFFQFIKQENMAMGLVKIMESLGVAKNTYMLNAAARNGHQEVVTKMLFENVSLDENSLCSAIKGENEELVRVFLKKGATVNDSESKYEDPYSEAIRTENERIIQILVEHHALERLDQWGPWLAAWRAAVKVCDKDILRMLLSKRKSIPGHHLGYALSVVTKLGDKEMAMELLERGADLETSSSPKDGYFSGPPPLIEALNVDNTTLADLFLDAGADPSVEGRCSDLWPIEIAVRQGNHAMVERLLGAGAQPQDAFNVAFAQKDFKMMERLFYAGAEIQEALETAAEDKNADACNWLLSRGADPRDSQALTSAYEHKSPVFETLLKACKERYPLGAAGFGSDALCSALESRDRPAVELLMKYGADPNGFVLLPSEEYRRMTPFLFAVTRDEDNSTSMAELFLDYGRKSKFFKCTPQTIVAELGVPQITKTYATRRINGIKPPGAMTTALLAAVGAKNMHMVRLLSRQEEADIDFPALGRIKRTPLQRAAEVGSLDLVDFFYGSGANVNAPPARIGGATALQLAALGGFTAIVIYLLNRGADVNAPGAVIDGMTALECAAAWGRVDALHVLLRANAGQGGRDFKQFQKALALAKKENHVSIVDILQAHFESTG